MTEILSTLLVDLLGSAFETFNLALAWILTSMLHVESTLDSAVSRILTEGAIGSVYEFIYRFACALIILKFLFRGFQIYILWRDGDADSSPQDMLIGAIEGVVVMVTFPYLYDVMAEVTLWFATGTMDRFGLSTSVYFWPTLDGLRNLGLFLLLMLVVYVILTVVLCLKLMKRGFELLVLRLGIPIACLGLLDSDLGLFKGYIQTFYKTMFTSVIQITLMSLSARVIAQASFVNIFMGVTIVMMAFGTPALMQNMLIAPSHGGGISNKIYTAGMAVRGLLRK